MLWHSILLSSREARRYFFYKGVCRHYAQSLNWKRHWYASSILRPLHLLVFFQTKEINPWWIKGCIICPNIELFLPNVYGTDAEVFKVLINLLTPISNRRQEKIWTRKFTLDVTTLNCSPVPIKYVSTESIQNSPSIVRMQDFWLFLVVAVIKKTSSEDALTTRCPTVS